MVNAKARAEKLKEIQEMGLAFHNSLVAEFDKDLFREGGCLFLGKFYADSNTISFGINPGTGGLKSGHPFGVDLDKEEGSNRPFKCSERARKDIRLFGNWHRFLSECPDLCRWFNDRVTSTFLVPWRTENTRELAKLNKTTKGKIYEYSGKLVLRMIDHHEATLLIVAGKRGLHLLNEVLPGGPWVPKELERLFFGPGGFYQWRKRFLTLNNRITVLQILHFARASNLEKLKELAQRLRDELKPFGL
jgi:hypothetical protein